MKRFWIFSLILFTQQVIAQKTDPMAAYKAAIKAQQKATGMPLSTDMPFLQGNSMPTKDPKVLASIPKTTLNASQLQAYIQKTVAGVTKKVSAKSLQDADAVAAIFKTKYPSVNYYSDAAKVLWLVGANEPALVLMGRAALQDPSDAEILNNYAAILTQHSGGQLALPILQNLNARFPGNSTILNNIGQAWFSLGDFSHAGQYLDTAIKIFPMHSMANYTKAIIEESKGNKQAAVQNMKASIKAAYSDDKAKRIEDMDGKLSSDDITWNIPKQRDEMGFGKFVAMRPAFYFSRGDIPTLAPLWMGFIEAVQNKIEALSKEVATLMASPEPPGPEAQRPVMIARKASQLRDLLAQEENERMDRFFKEIGVLNEQFTVIRESLTAEMEAIAKQFPPPANGTSESREVMERRRQAECAAFRKSGDQLFELNKALNDQISPFLSDLKSIVSDKAYYDKYSFNSDRSYQISLLTSQSQFLGFLGGISTGMTGQMVSQPMCIDCGLIIENGDCDLKPEKIVPHSMNLPDFDSIHCDTHGSFSIGGNGYFWDCNNESIKLDKEIAFLKLKIDYRENWVKQTYSKKFEFVISKSIGSKNMGPLSAEASVGAGAFWESSDKGVSDVGVIGTVDITGKVGVGEHTRDIGSVGLEGRVGINSGPTVTGSGLLSGFVNL
jgi:tetratricopeptide (TPR) repeat protein